MENDFVPNLLMILFWVLIDHFIFNIICKLNWVIIFKPLLFAPCVKSVRPRLQFFLRNECETRDGPGRVFAILQFS